MVALQLDHHRHADSLTRLTQLRVKQTFLAHDGEQLGGFHEKKKQTKKMNTSRLSKYVCPKLPGIINRLVRERQMTRRKRSCSCSCTSKTECAFCVCALLRRLAVSRTRSQAGFTSPEEEARARHESAATERCC